MLYGLLLTLFVIMCPLLILFILIQKGKGGMGIGSMGGGSQMLFGGTGGQDFFQKATWTMGTIFMVGSLLLSIWASHYTPRYAIPQKAAQPIQSTMPVSQPVAPAQTPSAPAAPAANIPAPVAPAAQQ
jgi:preprotein translocase subunit SecG